jgi:ABC-type phosphate/phosphonate transport system substrate-binding protein
MVLLQSRACPERLLFFVVLQAAILGVPHAANAAEPKVDLLRIGTTGTLIPTKEAAKEKGGLQSLRSFIKEETGLKNDIIRVKSWQELVDKLAKGELHVAVFEGYEFAWAHEQDPGLKPLALAVNVYRYPEAYVVTRKDNKAKDLAGLQGQSLYLPEEGQSYLQLFVERQCQGMGKELKTFFSKIASAETVEDGLDDVVDGKVGAGVVDQASLAAYKRRKPGRFKQLKLVARSKPFPPAVIVYHEKGLDEGTLQRLRDGLRHSEKTEKGRMTLTLYHLTGFEEVPKDFEKVLADTRKTYPPPK